MSWDQVEGNWKRLKANVKQQWAKLTDTALDRIDGKRRLHEGAAPVVARTEILSSAAVFAAACRPTRETANARRHRGFAVFAGALVLASTSMLAACEDEPDNIGEAVEELGEEIEEAGDEIADEIDDHS